MSQNDKLSLSSFENLPGQSHYQEVQITADSRLKFLSTTDEARRNVINWAIHETNGIIDRESNKFSELTSPPQIISDADNDATSFVKGIIEPLPHTNLYLIPEENEHYKIGFSSSYIGAVATRQLAETPATLWPLAIRSNLVHERAHTSGMATRKIIIVGKRVPHEAESDELTLIHSTSFGMQKPKIYYDQELGLVDLSIKNSFLEEAFAEETASVYRESMYENSDVTVSVLCGDGNRRDLPIRYCSTNLDDPTYYEASRSAFAAHTIHLLSDYTGVNLYDLLVLSRDPEYEVAAKREIVQVIEIVEKGLYRTLREMPYPDDSAAHYELYDKIVTLTKANAELALA